jgi:hypothetical protein
MTVRLSLLHASHLFLPPGIFLLLISVRDYQPQDNTLAQTIRAVENSIDLNGNQTHDILSYSILPQPAMLLLDLEKIKLSACKEAIRQIVYN